MKLKRLVLVSTVVITAFLQSHAQTNSTQGIVFLQNVNWQEILQKAKAENKYIFVDCYASWCAPCKWMDQNVYANDTIGDFLNKAFVPVRVQMDTTRQDNTSVRDWYVSAHEIGQRYGIKAYPSYLFFSPDGKAVHIANGAVNMQDFLALVKAAMDPQLQYYTLIAEYRSKSLGYVLMPYLANIAKKLQEDSLYYVIASDYLQHLAKLPESDLWTKDNIEFIEKYSEVIYYGDTIFARYFRDKIKIDSIMGSPVNTRRLINTVAYNGDVKPRIDEGLKDGSEPDWHILEQTIAKKYGEAFVSKNLIKAREEYYRAIKKWDNYTKYFVLEMESINIKSLPPGSGTSMGINNSAFEVFKYSKRKRELEEALSWIDYALSMNAFQAAELDTKANLLYKLGRKSEAIICEEKSHNLAPENKEIRENYEKMKDGQPTW